MRGATPPKPQYYREALALVERNQGNGMQICGLFQRLALNFERAGDIPGALECWSSACEHIVAMGDVMQDSEAVSDVLTRYASFSAPGSPATHRK